MVDRKNWRLQTEHIRFRFHEETKQRKHTCLSVSEKNRQSCFNDRNPIGFPVVRDRSFPISISIPSPGSIRFPIGLFGFASFCLLFRACRIKIHSGPARCFTPRRFFVIFFISIDSFFTDSFHRWWKIKKNVINWPNVFTLIFSFNFFIEK